MPFLFIRDSQKNILKMNNRKMLHILAIFVVLLTIITSGAGVFFTDGGVAFKAVSQYGNEIELYGNGIYKNDAYFLAPIFRGTDFAMLVIVVPLLIYFIISDKKKRSFKSLLRLVSLLFVILYYTINLAFGVVFNPLHLVYTFLLSISLFTLVFGNKILERNYYTGFSTTFQPSLGLKIFIIISGIALFVAWLPDIIIALTEDKPLTYLENYTTSVTYILDMGFISPMLFLSLYLLKKQPFYGVCLLSMLLYLSMIIGLILPAQTWFQLQSGIDIPLPALITKVAIFILLATFAFYFNRKLYSQI